MNEKYKIEFQCNEFFDSNNCYKIPYAGNFYFGQADERSVQNEETFEEESVKL